MEEEEMNERIMRWAMKVHSVPGAGFLEPVYANG